jgi:hypothetical protein
MERERRNERGTSYEGNLFSVSACPEAWRSIARLGGEALNVCDDQIALVDVIEVFSSEKHEKFREHLERWAFAMGYVEKATFFSVPNFDEDGDEYVVYCQSYDEALEEVGDTDLEIKEVEKIVPTEYVRKIHNLPKSGYEEGLEFALIEWIQGNREKLAVDVAGVYWDETYEPSSLSAPRGGLFDPKEHSFKTTQAWPDDEEGLSGVVTGLTTGDVSEFPHKFRISRAIKRVAEKFDPEIFESGKCQDLAIALLKADDYKGSLAVCIRDTLNEDGSVHCSTFSHMMYETADNEIWDIGGKYADGRWEDRFPDIGEPDKWGMTDELRWETVPCTGPDHKEAIEWLAGFSAGIDEDLQRQLAEIIAAPAAAQAQVVLYHGTDMESARSILSGGIDQEKSHKGYFGVGFYCADDESLARSNYAEFSDGEAAVLAVTLSSDARLLDLSTEEGFLRWRDSGLTQKVGQDRFDLLAVAAGIDALRDNSFGGVVVYNPDAVASMVLLEPVVSCEQEPDRPAI